MGVIDRRDTCYDSWNGRPVPCNSTWNSWGRWVAFGLIVAAAILFFLMFACFNARRRRARGAMPIYGTQWMAPPPYRRNEWQNPPPQYEQQDPNYGYYRPPAETPAQGGYHGGYTGQENGIELQQPQHAYHGGDQVYAPPPGPPPAKK